MKRNPLVTIGAVLAASSLCSIDAAATQSIQVRLKTLEATCRKLMAPGLYRHQAKAGQDLLLRILTRLEKPSPLELMIGVLLTARLCDQDLDPTIRAIFILFEKQNPTSVSNPLFHPPMIVLEPSDLDFCDPGHVSVLVDRLCRSAAAAK